MTRRDVERNFTMDGGLQFFSKSGFTTCYVYSKCEFIRITVAFNAAQSKMGSPSPDDIVVRVSKPYLEYAAKD
jgi:hypothetical protein